MTPFKNFSKNTIWSRRIRRGGLYVAVATMLSSCSNDNGTDWEEVTTYEATKGVVTTLEETENGKFSIVDEQVVEGKAASRLIIKRRSGAVDTLTLEQAKSLVQNADTAKTVQQHRHSNGLGHVVWWGAMGYLMGRNFSSPVQSYIYRDDRRYNGGYSAGQRASEELRRTAVSRTEMRPVKSRSGFFRSWGRGSNGG